jgi:hypothetical protein
MLLKDASVMVTSDVVFPVEDMPQTTLTDTTSDSEWVREATAAFDQRPSAHLAPEGRTPGDADGSETDKRANRRHVESTSVKTTGNLQSADRFQQGSRSPTPPAIGNLQDAAPAGNETEGSVIPTTDTPTTTDVPASEGQGDHGDAEPSFADPDGNTVTIGDRVTVTRDGTAQVGVVADIDTSDFYTPGGEVRVDHADGTEAFERCPLLSHRRMPMRKRFDALAHRALVGVFSQPVCLRLATVQGPREPHPSVRPCLDDNGNTLLRCLDGTATLPPARAPHGSSNQTQN